MLYTSTQFENNMIPVTNSRGQERLKPLPIVQYNAHMKGDDRMDQLMSYYPCEWKTLRWNLKIFIHVLQMLVVNSYHLHNMHTAGKKMTLYDFRLSIIESLLPPKGNAVRVIPPPARAARHHIVKSKDQDARGGTKRKRCRQCFQEGNRAKKTVYICEVCPDKPGLCPGKCFDQFHQNLT